MRFIEYMLEKRSHDTPKLGIVEALSKYKNDPDIYISYTDVEKLGINPIFGYNTPLGIYFYPLKEMWNDVINNSIPFAGERKWVWVVRAKDLLDLDKYSEKNLTEDIIKLTVEFKPKGIEKDFDRAYEDAKRDAKNNRGKLIFYFTHNLASWGNSQTVEWSRILRKVLNYKGVRDTKSIIHPNEPIQAIIFTLRDLEIVDKISNIRPRANISIAKTLREFLAPNIVQPQYLNSMISSMQTEYILSGRVLVKAPAHIWANISLDDFKFLLELKNKNDTISTRSIMEVIRANKYRPDIVKVVIDYKGIPYIDNMTDAIHFLRGRTTINRIEEYLNGYMEDYGSYGNILLNIKDIVATMDFNTFKTLTDDLVYQYTDFSLLGRIVLKMKKDQKETLAYLIGALWSKTTGDPKPSIDSLIKTYSEYVLGEYKFMHPLIDLIDKRSVAKYYK
jgi:hypothetical protein